MFKETKKTINWGNNVLTLETGKVARQADGAIVATMGDTVILATAVAQKKPKEGIDFFPLTVHYREMAFAGGKIPGGFFKREGRPAEREVLASRLIDRPIRPLFDDNYCNETQVICTLLSFDPQNDPEVVALVAASAALAISGIPFLEAIAGARIGYANGEYILNPTPAEIESSELDLFVAGTKTSVLMVESEAKELSEAVMLGAVEFGHKSLQPVIEGINELVNEIGKPRWEVIKPDHSEISALVRKLAKDKIREAYSEGSKQKRYKLLDKIKEEVIAKIVAEKEIDPNLIKSQIKKLEADIVRNDIIFATKKRIDGRVFDEIRKIDTEISVLPRTHGSALFTRGETQSLGVVTLGTEDDAQIIDALVGESKDHFMLHYNFPPYSVGEASQLKPPGRREIGHGRLARKALTAVLPNKIDFPYTIRVVSEITECNGSSSMATICSSSLAMMDAGVPLKSPVAGIAMGLILENKDHVILSDIMGDEDHLGDMDFKVAGTAHGITALQMDIKVNGITTQIMKEALAQAKEGIIHILERMSTTIISSKLAISTHAPTITTMNINPDKIREVIGSGGKVIRSICEESGAKIEIQDDGTIKIAATNEESSAKAIKLIQDIVCEPVIGQIYSGKVVKILEFGAFVNFMGSRDGLVHVSEIINAKLDKVESVLKEGDLVKVKVLDVDHKGKIRLSMKCVDQETGEDLSGNQDGNDGDKHKHERKENSSPRGDNNRIKRGKPSGSSDYPKKPYDKNKKPYNAEKSDYDNNRDKPSKQGDQNKNREAIKFFS